MERFTQDQKDALNYFCNAYMNTGCDEDEAIEHSEFMLAQCDGIPDLLYNEAQRYRDM